MRRQPRRVRGSLRWLVVIVAAALIFVASVVRPGPGIANRGPFGLLYVSTWLHLGAYGFLTLTLLYALLADGEAMVHPVVIPVIVLSYGAFIELVQFPIPYRSFAIGDILANGTGSLVIVAVWMAGRPMLVHFELRRS